MNKLFKILIATAISITCIFSLGCKNGCKPFHFHKYDQQIKQEEFLKEKRSDALVIATQDRDHVDMCIRALELGYDVLLEKPITPIKEDLYRLLDAQKKYGGKVVVCHVLRYAPAFVKIKELLDSGVIGKTVCIDWIEQVAYWHIAHSFVRGNWHSEQQTSPMILAKCSHDIDIISTIANSQARRVAAFGSLDHFTTDKLKYNHCSECPDQECPYRFKGEFVRMNEQEKANPSEKHFDLCVYNDDKDVVDHEVLIIDFANGIKANFSLNLFSGVSKRVIDVCGTKAILHADTSEECIKITYSDGKDPEIIECKADNDSGHGGSDQRFLDDFVDCILNERPSTVDFNAGLASTVIGNAAEESRLTNKVVEIAPEAYMI
mgnify:CR=1 FL=1